VLCACLAAGTTSIDPSQWDVSDARMKCSDTKRDEMLHVPVSEPRWAPAGADPCEGIVGGRFHSRGSSAGCCEGFWDAESSRSAMRVGQEQGMGCCKASTGLEAGMGNVCE
jgi:hypothetical protein